MMRFAIAVVVVGLFSAPAFAQSLPGTGDDPIRVMMVEPSVVSTELPVLAIHGGNPEDTVLLFDGFPIPVAFHAGGVRSVLAPDSIAELELMPSGFGVEYGGGSSIVSLVSPAHGRSFLQGTAVDGTLHVAAGSLELSARLGSAYLARSTGRDEGHFEDVLARYQQRISTRWAMFGSLIWSSDAANEFGRVVLAGLYDGEVWRARLSASMLSYTGLSADTRVELLRSADRAAGLTKVDWRIGQQTSSTHYDVSADSWRGYDVTSAFWRHDVGVWTSVAGNLSPRIRATAGLRVDNFDGDVATQPRAALLGQPHPKLILALAAGAYRRPPEQPAELGHDLAPERATHVAAGALFDDKHGLRVNAVAYYIDRRRLVVRDGEGELGNTGFGSSLGVDLAVDYREGAWWGRLATALTRSKRFDYVRAAEHPADYEQPFRLDVIGGWRKSKLALSARLQLASGLPFTPYSGAIYDSDTDTYEPLYVPPLSARAPFHHQIDLRVDYRVVKRGWFALDVYLDLHNAYRNEDALAYRYSYDYSERTAITALPLFPFAGVRGYL